MPLIWSFDRICALTPDKALQVNLQSSSEGSDMGAIAINHQTEAFFFFTFFKPEGEQTFPYSVRLRQN